MVCAHAIVFALVEQTAQLTKTDTVFAFLHSFTAGLLGAGTRLGVLGHMTAQQTLAAIAPDLETVAQNAALANLDDLWSCTPTLTLLKYLIIVFLNDCSLLKYLLIALIFVSIFVHHFVA